MRKNKYKVMLRHPRYFETLEEAIECANRILEKTGDFVEIREIQ